MSDDSDYEDPIPSSELARRATERPDVCPKCGNQELHGVGFALLLPHPEGRRECRRCGCVWTLPWTRSQGASAMLLGYLAGWGLIGCAVGLSGALLALSLIYKTFWLTPVGAGLVAVVLITLAVLAAAWLLPWAGYGAAAGRGQKAECRMLRTDLPPELRPPGSGPKFRPPKRRGVAPKKPGAV